MCSVPLAFHVTATLLDRKEILEGNNLECLHLILYIASLESKSSFKIALNTDAITEIAKKEVFFTLNAKFLL